MLKCGFTVIIIPPLIGNYVCLILNNKYNLDHYNQKENVFKSDTEKQILNATEKDKIVEKML